MSRLGDTAECILNGFRALAAVGGAETSALQRPPPVAVGEREGTVSPGGRVDAALGGT